MALCILGSVANTEVCEHCLQVLKNRMIRLVCGDVMCT